MREVRGFFSRSSTAVVRLCVATVAGYCGLVLTAPAPAGAQEGMNAGTLSPSSIIIEQDDRQSPAAFGRANGLSPSNVDARFGATGLVRCGGATGTGQLVGANNVLVTASHVLFSAGGKPREACRFEIDVGGRQISVPVKTEQATCGSKEPYAQSAVKDWAVAPLAEPVLGVRPYRLASSMNVPGPVVLASVSRSGGRLLEQCRARQVTASAPTGLREVALDCDAEGGTSGAALLSETGNFLGVYVGYRSTHPGRPGPFSMQHYNFGLTAEGGLRRAIAQVADRNQPVSASR
jgi:hypothetical protein